MAFVEDERWRIVGVVAEARHPGGMVGHVLALVDLDDPQAGVDLFRQHPDGAARRRNGADEQHGARRRRRLGVARHDAV